MNFIEAHFNVFIFEIKLKKKNIPTPTMNI